jgi:hypothetical protein
MAKLSPNQRTVLAQAAVEGQVWRADTGRVINVWHVRLPDGRVEYMTRTVVALIHKGLVWIDDDSPRYRLTLSLTDTGRAELAALKEA